MTNLDPEPWIDELDGKRKAFGRGPYLPIGQLGDEFAPREGYSQNIEDYPKKPKRRRGGKGRTVVDVEQYREIVTEGPSAELRAEIREALGG